MSFEDELKYLREKIEQFGETLNTIKDNVLLRLSGIESFLGVQANYSPPTVPPNKDEGPKTEEACKEKRGEWNEENKSCKLPTKEDTTEGLQSVGILPTSGGTPIFMAKARAKALVSKVIGEET